MTDTGRVTEAGMIGSHDDDPDSESGIRGAVHSHEFASSTTSSTTMASDPSAAGGGGTSPPKKIIEAPETPLWRFINMAKKREGYSSTAAGTIVEGTSNSFFFSGGVSVARGNAVSWSNSSPTLMHPQHAVPPYRKASLFYAVLLLTSACWRMK
jgi:hypothetical protein